MASPGIAPVIGRGMVAVQDRAANIHQEDWRRKAYEVMPQGRTPVTKFLMQTPGKATTSRITHWWIIPFNAMQGTVTDVFTDSALASAYSSGGVSGTTLYLKLTANDAKQIVRNDTLLVIDALGNDRAISVFAVNVGDDSTSYVAGRLLETDTGNKLAGATLYWVNSGHAEAEGSPLPDSTYEELVPLDNNTEIFMESFDLTGTEEVEAQRVDEAVFARLRRQALNRLNIKMERAFLFGRKNTLVGQNGKQQRFLQGLVPMIKQYAPDNIFDFSTDTNYTAAEWLDGGWDFLKNLMVQIARFSDSETMQMFLGDEAWLAINNLVEVNGLYKIDETTNSFGLRCKRLTGLSLDLELIKHPLFSVTTPYRKSALITDLSLLRRRPMNGRDLTYIKPRQRDEDGSVWFDGKKAGWMCEQSFEADNLDAQGWITNIGVDNSLT